MKYLDNDTQNTLKDFLKDANKKTTIVLFNSPDAVGGEETTTLLREITSLKDNLHLEEKNLEADQALAETYGVELAPGYVLLNEDDAFTRVRFSGAPLGHEINSLLNAISEVAGEPQEMPTEMMERVKKIDKPVTIKVFVTLQCPHCPGAVQKAHALALHNPNIQAEMIEAESFPQVSNHYGVGSVPHTVFNDGHDLIGNLPFEEFITNAEKA